ncbi:MAG TPA: hypothetical protein VN374_04815 [Desulfitobacteriaceae bacterium]|nr:hypothetical protein [Desulfitobacteriaceae bacterium]
MKMLISDEGKKGYALVDVLMALFLFSISFSVVYGLTETAVSENQQTANLTQAMNIARKSMERLAERPWSENLAEGGCIPSETVTGNEGLFDWTLCAEWDEYPELLNIEIEVEWLEKGKIHSYYLGSVYYVD